MASNINRPIIFSAQSGIVTGSFAETKRGKTKEFLSLRMDNGRLISKIAATAVEFIDVERYSQPDPEGALRDGRRNRDFYGDVARMSARWTP